MLCAEGQSDYFLYFSVYFFFFLVQDQLPKIAYVEERGMTLQAYSPVFSSPLFACPVAWSNRLLQLEKSS